MTKNPVPKNPVNDDPQDDPVATAILAAIEAAGGATIAPREVAQALAAQHPKPRDRPDAWRRYLTAVRQQALHLARNGRIQLVRRGQPVDPHNVKGVIRLGPPSV